MERIKRMKKLTIYSKERIKYLNKRKRDKFLVIFLRLFLLVALLALWEMFAETGVIDAFITSSPSRIVITVKNLFVNDNFLYHIGITLYETVVGFILAVGIGYMVALLLWWSDRIRKVLEPYIVVLNSLPKIALGPIIIIWFDIIH